MSTYLADQIRACAAHPDAEHLRQLQALAVQVERLERVLDEQVAQAAIDERAVSLQRWIR